MKKFLSLVLALIMAMSLVTMGAGAVSYEELTDKDEISSDREEAVAVLNALNIIGGYPDGSYKPQGALTRQVAAKFIVSLLIGPEAAENLTVATAPYPDVPTSSQFAGYISYCKTANIISGYSDGTFRPEGSLTGYAFAKMLLGAIGYRGDIEGFTGTGWTMNVAKIGNAANLFDRLQFQGGETLNREDAAQLCLNTLKATMVEYSGGFNITAGDATVVGAMTRSYVTSNQAYAANISNRKAGNVQQGSNTGAESHYTVEFGEEHFKDLVLNDEHTLGGDRDVFGRPANHWSLKKVTIGYFAIEPDFRYDSQMAVIDSNPSEAAKVRALGLNGYKVDKYTQLTVNGADVAGAFAAEKVGDIANWTDNGVEVEVYVSEDATDYISNVVVIYTQLMQVRKVGSEAVSLKLYKDDGGAYTAGETAKHDGFNMGPFDKEDASRLVNAATLSRLEDVDVNDDCFEFLSGLKADDIVAVVPVSEDDGISYSVAYAYKPETVTGALTGAKDYANNTAEPEDRTAIEVTVGGTTYKVANWNYDLKGINQTVLKVTKKDVTIHLDEFGNVLLIEDVGATGDFMILGAWRNALENGVVVRLATGWDIKGNAVSLNVGAEKSTKVQNDYAGIMPGDVLRYQSTSTVSNADWELSKNGVFDVKGNEGNETYKVRASNPTVKLVDKNNELGSTVTAQPQISSTVKTIYVAFSGGEVDYIEVKSGLQDITEAELTTKGTSTHGAEATVGGLTAAGLPKSTANVTAIVIKKESKDATINNVGYVYDFHATTEKTDDGWVTEYNVYTQDGNDVKMKSTNNIGNRKFVRYIELDNGLYRLTLLDTDPGSRVFQETDVDLFRLAAEGQGDDYRYILDGERKYTDKDGKSLVTRLAYTEKQVPYIYYKETPGSVQLTDGDTYKGMISVYGAKIVDLRETNNKVSNAKELKALVKGETTSGKYSKNGNTLVVDIAYNDNSDSDNFRTAYYVIIKDAIANTVSPYNKTGTNGRGEASAGSQDDTSKPVDPGKNNGFVKMAEGLDGTGSKKLGTITGDSQVVETLTGDVRVSFTLNVPDWAAPTNVDNAVKVRYRVLADKDVLSDKATDVVANKEYNSATEGEDLESPSATDLSSYSIKDLEVVKGGANVRPLVAGKKIVVEIYEVTYNNVKIRYINGDDGLPLKNAPTSQSVSTTKGTGTNTGTFKGYITAAVDGNTWEALGVTNKISYDNIYKENTNDAIKPTDGNTSSDAVYAKSVDYATITISGLKAKNAGNLSATTPTKYSTAKDRGFLLSSIGTNVVLKNFLPAGTTTCDDKVLIQIVDIDGSNPLDGSDTTGYATNQLSKDTYYRIKVEAQDGTTTGATAGLAGYKFVFTVKEVGGSTLLDGAGGTVSLAVGGNNDVTAGAFKTGSKDIEIDVAVELLEPIKFTSATFTPFTSGAAENGGTMTLVLNRALKLADNDNGMLPGWVLIDKSSGAKLVESQNYRAQNSADGKSCTITFTVDKMTSNMTIGLIMTLKTTDNEDVKVDSTHHVTISTTNSGAAWANDAAGKENSTFV